MDELQNMSAQETEVSKEVMASVKRARQLIASGSHTEAAEQLEHVLVLHHESTYFWERLGTCYRECSQLESAEYCYQRARALDLQNFDAAFHWGVLKMDMREWCGAERQFRDAAALRPNDGPTLMNLASAVLQLGRKAEWQEIVEQAVRVDPSVSVPAAWKQFLGKGD